MIPKEFLPIVLFLSLFSLVSSEAESFGKSFQEDVTISARQKEILDIFKKRVSYRLRVPYMKEEFFLIRWLRARNFDLDQAERMLIDHLRWWDDNKMDTIEDEDWSDISRDFPWWRMEDKEGRPVLYLNFGDWNLRRAALTGKTERVLRYLCMAFEITMNDVRKLGNDNQNVSQAIVLINNQGFNVATHACLQCIPFILRMITIYENHFPGYLNKIIVVNSPAVAEWIADAARRTFHPETRSIFRVYGRNKRQWGPVLEKYLDKSQIPTELGGSNNLEGLEMDYEENE